MINFLNFTIRWSFYLLFFLIPLVFYAGSSELFEYNKMMLTYGLTIIIVGAWISKMIVEKRLIFRRTYLDIPILLYLASHIISTIFSLDIHTSIWGYYSRFHEGLLATISYIALYYALVSNLGKAEVIKMLLSSFASGVIVSIWGAFEHFGASPSCLFITGKFDVDCWIQDVKNRVFATLGQPNWMAAYLDVLILSGLGFVLSIKNNALGDNKSKADSPVIRNTLYVILIGLFFAALLFTKSRSGLLGLIAGAAVFATGLLIASRSQITSYLKNKSLLTLLALLFLLTLLFGLPFTQIENLNLEHALTKKSSQQTVAKPANPSGYIDIGISESGDIRRIVWKGALKVWQRYPIFGSGVETFAFAYYKDRPVEHNLVSEWDFLYNKAHNEFLNILATTGTVGMLAYLSMIGVYSWWVYKKLRSNPSLLAPSSLIIALYAAYISILVTNFFGFSVVIIGIFFFLIPGLSQLLENDAQQAANGSERSSLNNLTMKQSKISAPQWIGISGVNLINLVLLINLVSMWSADKAYAYGKNLNGISEYVRANPYLIDAVKTNSGEPLFKDELSYNESIIASSLFSQEASSSAEQRATDIKPYLDLAIGASNEAVGAEPNNLTFWKTRTKVFYQLSNIDQNYITTSLEAIQKAADLAPTDPKVHYNLALILGRVGRTDEAIRAFEQTVNLKPDYGDAHYALALYYDQQGDKARARAQMEFIIAHIGPDDRAQKWLDDNK